MTTKEMHDIFQAIMIIHRLKQGLGVLLLGILAVQGQFATSVEIPWQPFDQGYADLLLAQKDAQAALDSKRASDGFSWSFKSGDISLEENSNHTWLASAAPGAVVDFGADSGLSLSMGLRGSSILPGGLEGFDSSRAWDLGASFAMSLPLYRLEPERDAEYRRLSMSLQRAEEELNRYRNKQLLEFLKVSGEVLTSEEHSLAAKKKVLEAQNALDKARLIDGIALESLRGRALVLALRLAESSAHEAQRAASTAFQDFKRRCKPGEGPTSSEELGRWLTQLPLPDRRFLPENREALAVWLARQDLLEQERLSYAPLPLEIRLLGSVDPHIAPDGDNKTGFSTGITAKGRDFDASSTYSLSSEGHWKVSASLGFKPVQPELDRLRKASQARQLEKATANLTRAESDYTLGLADKIEGLSQAWAAWEHEQESTRLARENLVLAQDAYGRGIISTGDFAEYKAAVDAAVLKDQLRRIEILRCHAEIEVLYVSVQGGPL